MRYLIWADRVAVVWGGLLLTIMFIAWRGAEPMLSDPGVWHILGLIVGIPWMILRGLDLIVTGQFRLCRATSPAKPLRPGAVEIIPPGGRL